MPQCSRLTESPILQKQDCKNARIEHLVSKSWTPLSQKSDPSDLDGLKESRTKLYPKGSSLDPRSSKWPFATRGLRPKANLDLLNCIREGKKAYHVWVFALWFWIVFHCFLQKPNVVNLHIRSCWLHYSRVMRRRSYPYGSFRMYCNKWFLKSSLQSMMHPKLKMCSCLKVHYLKLSFHCSHVLKLLAKWL